MQIVPHETTTVQQDGSAMSQASVGKTEQQEKPHGTPSHNALEPLFYLSLFEQLPFALVVLDTTGMAVAANRKAEEHSLYKPIVGHYNIYKDQQAVEKGYLEAFQQALQGKVTKINIVSSDTMRASTKEQRDECLVAIETTYTPFYDTSQTVCYVLEIRQEMNDRQQMIQDLRPLERIAAGAIHHYTVKEETNRYIRQVQSLRTIDQAITANLDLNFTLNIVLDQVFAHLDADATDVLLYNPVTLELEYAVGRGFHSNAIARTRVHPGEGCAGRVALERKFIAVSDIRDCDKKGLRVQYLKEENLLIYYGIPLISGGQIKGVLEIFRRTPLNIDQDWIDFFHALAGQAAIAIDHAELLAHFQSTNDELILSYDATIAGWASALELRDAETEGHSRRVTTLTLKLAAAMGISGERLIHIRRGAILHDIGKMAIPDRILLKPNALTPDEEAVMQLHPVYAYQWLSPIPFLSPAMDIPYCHHERWDGTGYPRKLKGEQIPLAARIFAIIDVWDALRSDRPYRKAWSKERTKEYIRDHSGTHFDPRIVELFLSLLLEDNVDLS